MNQTTSKNGVDTHFHVFQAFQAVDGARYVPQYTASLIDWQALAQGVGVTRGVVVQPSFLGVDNGQMLTALRAFPDVLRGVAVVAPDTRVEALDALHAAGVRGIRLNLAGVSHHVGDWTRAESLWCKLHELGWHLEVHTDQGALPQVLVQLPAQIALVVDHMGKPGAAQPGDPTVKALTQRAQGAATYVKLSGAYRLGGLDAASLARLWLHELGSSALLWGSDWPCTNHEDKADYSALFSSLESWIGPDHCEQVLLKNPLRLYWS